MLTQYRQSDGLDPHRLIDTFQDSELSSVLSELVAFEWDTEALDAEAVKIIEAFGDKKVRKLRDRLKAELTRAQSEGNRERADEILKEMQENGLI
jgi:hypothetical protein